MEKLYGLIIKNQNKITALILALKILPSKPQDQPENYATMVSAWDLRYVIYS